MAAWAALDSTVKLKPTDRAKYADQADRTKLHYVKNNASVPDRTIEQEGY